MHELSYSTAFSAGVASFLSPCVFALIPLYVSFIAGMSFCDLSEVADRTRIRKLTVANSLLFLLGFSAAFITLGMSSSDIGNLFASYQSVIGRGGGILIIVFGFYVIGWGTGFLLKDKKVRLQGRPAGFVGDFLAGVTFAAGWTPCVGPILGSILLYTSSAQSAVQGFKLLTVYSLGLAVPFFGVAVAFNSILSFIPKINHFRVVISVASGILMVASGLLFLTGSVSALQGMLPDFSFNLVR